ncbi:MAG: acyl-CoA dehydrogenase family protein, partial [Thermodesulfobacteriota bacterium]
MDNLVGILDSFRPGWRQKEYVDNMVGILRDLVLPSYFSLEARIEGNRAVFTPDWDRILAAFKEAGILRLFVPTEYEGQKIPEEDLYYLMELLGYSSPGLGVMFVSHGRAVDIILRGEEEQKREFLPRMAQGVFGAIAMTEEKAGSDAGAVGLMARQADGRFLLNGQKIFISNSGLAGVYAVLVNTKGGKGARNLSVLVVEKDTPGFSVESLPEKEGLKVLPTGRLVFQDAPVPAFNLVGQDGAGLLLAMDVIDRGRIHIAGICCGLAYRIFREIYFYALKRRQFDHPLTSSQDVSFQLTDMYTKMNAARGLCFHALRQIGTPFYRVSSSQAKLFASQMVMDVAARAQVLMGGRGYFRNDQVNQLGAAAP